MCLLEMIWRCDFDGRMLRLWEMIQDFQRDGEMIQDFYGKRVSAREVTQDLEGRRKSEGGMI